MTVKERLHQLVDELPDTELHTAERFLACLRDGSGDRFLLALALAPEDDEPTTPEEEAGAAEARAEWRRGEGRPFDEVFEELARE
jgi:hypothetical protein